MFKLITSFEPAGDQPHAIKKTVRGLQNNQSSQVIQGITGSGKTFTMASVVAQVQKPTLILAHNKTLAAQLYQEFKGFFPYNAVEYFVSYYDYYQPEAYIPRTDTYIEKDMAINEKIDRMRLSATRSLIERRDVLIVSSVSCIYGLGMPEFYCKMALRMHKGQKVRRDNILLHLVELHYKRNDFELARGTFRVRGDILEIAFAYEESLACRVEFFGDEIERLSLTDPLTGRVLERREEITVFPASHHVTPEEVRFDAMETIKKELEERLAFFQESQNHLAYERIRQRTRYDLEMIREVGFCKGIENYSRHFSGRPPGAAPACLIDYFPEDYLLFVDESHQTLPQVHAMYNGDRARKNNLVEFGFRLPSAFDNRPLKFEEFQTKLNQVVYVSATPSPWEVEQAGGEVIPLIIRPTGLLDPLIEVRPATLQVDDALEEIRKETERGGRILVTVLTKKLAEDLSKFLQDIGVKAKYLHSEIDTIERIQIIKELRQGIFDVLVGINLLREGLDIPEVSLVTILDADKEGFLRSATALIQTCGRAARNVEGRVIMYADRITDSIRKTLDITLERRKLQEEHNRTHGITPTTVLKKTAEDLLETFGEIPQETAQQVKYETLSQAIVHKKIEQLKKEMKLAAKQLRFEAAAALRDELHHYEQMALLD